MQSPEAHDFDGVQREDHEIARKAGKAESDHNSTEKTSGEEASAVTAKDADKKMKTGAAGTEIDTAGDKAGAKRRDSDQENKTIKTSAVIQHLLPHSAENARCKRNQGFTGGGVGEDFSCMNPAVLGPSRLCVRALRSLVDRYVIHVRSREAAQEEVVAKAQEGSRHEGDGKARDAAEASQIGLEAEESTSSLPNQAKGAIKDVRPTARSQPQRSAGPSHLSTSQRSHVPMTPTESTLMGYVHGQSCVPPSYPRACLFPVAACCHTSNTKICISITVCYVAGPENASKESMDVAIKLGLFYSFLNPEKVPVHSKLLPCYVHTLIMC
jgi:hypothetical protein